MKAILFLLLAPAICFGQLSYHSRGTAMGDAGIAAAAGNQQLGYNIGKAVFTQHLHQVSVTYLPWMRHLFHDTKFIRADYMASIGESAALGFAIDYLDMGNLTTRDNNGASLTVYRNTAYRIGGSVGVRLSEHSGIGATLRLLGARNFEAGGAANRYGVSGDVQYYQTLGKFSFGAVVNNVGNDMWQQAEYGVGVAYSDRDSEGAREWMVGFDARKPLKGSLAATRFSLGAELGFEESFYVRSGVAFEHRDFGNRKYVSLGAAYKGYVSDQSWAIDVHYLIPFGVTTAVSPMQNSYGLTLSLNIGNFQ